MAVMETEPVAYCIQYTVGSGLSPSACVKVSYPSICHACVTSRNIATPNTSGRDPTWSDWPQRDCLEFILHMRARNNILYCVKVVPHSFT